MQGGFVVVRTVVGIMGLVFAVIALIVVSSHSSDTSGKVVGFLVTFVLAIILLSVWRGLSKGAASWTGSLAKDAIKRLAERTDAELPALDPRSLAMPSAQQLVKSASGGNEDSESASLDLGSIRLGDSLQLVQKFISARNACLGPAWSKHVDEYLSRPMPAEMALRDGEVLADAFSLTQESESGEMIRSMLVDTLLLEQLYLMPLAATYAQYLEALKRRDQILKDSRAVALRDQIIIAQESQKDMVNYTPDVSGYMHHIAEQYGASGHLNEVVPMRLPVLDSVPHTYITGGTGSGKSELLKNLALEYAMGDDAAVVVLDPHGSLANAIARHRDFAPGGALAGRLVYVDPTFGTSEVSPTLNPLDTEDRSARAVQVLAEQLTGAFEEVLGARQGSALTVNMVNMLGESLRALLTLGNRDLGDLRRLLVDNPELLAACRQVSDDPDVDYFGVEFRKEQLHQAKESLQGKLKAMLAGNRELFIGRSTIRLDELARERKVILFNLSKGVIGPLSSESLGRFVVATLCSMALRQEGKPEAERVKVRLIIDECHNFIGPSISTVLAETRKYGLTLTLCQQFAGQDMSPSFRQAVLANTGKKLCGRNEDAATLKTMADSMGLDVETLRALPNYAFMVKWGAMQPFVLRARSDRAGKQGAMGKRAWEQVKSAQLKAYYRSVEPRTSLDPAVVIAPPSSSRPQPQAAEPPPL